MEAVVDKQVSTCGKLWFMKQNEEVKVGFTAKFLEEVHKCWHVTPATNKKVEAKSPLLTVETDESLFTVNSPVSGELYSFSDAALNFPDNIQEDQVIAVIGPEKKKVAKAVPNMGNRIDIDLAQLEEQMVAQQRREADERHRQELRAAIAAQHEQFIRQQQQAQAQRQAQVQIGGNQWFAAPQFAVPQPPDPFARAPQPAAPRPVNPNRARRPR